MGSGLLSSAPLQMYFPRLSSSISSLGSGLCHAFRMSAGTGRPLPLLLLPLLLHDWCVGGGGGGGDHLREHLRLLPPHSSHNGVCNPMSTGSLCLTPVP